MLLASLPIHMMTREPDCKDGFKKTEPTRVSGAKPHEGHIAGALIAPAQVAVQLGTPLHIVS